jgi:hypothetical protein
MAATVSIKPDRLVPAVLACRVLAAFCPPALKMQCSMGDTAAHCAASGPPSARTCWLKRDCASSGIAVETRLLFLHPVRPAHVDCGIIA